MKLFNFFKKRNREIEKKKKLDDFFKQFKVANSYSLKSYLDKMEKGLSLGQCIGREFLHDLSYFIANKYQGNNVEAQKHLSQYEITDIEYDYLTSKVKVTLCRPGIFIGVRGAHIEEITNEWKQFAKEKLLIPFEGIELVEDRYPLRDDLLFATYSYEY